MKALLMAAFLTAATALGTLVLLAYAAIIIWFTVVMTYNGP